MPLRLRARTVDALNLFTVNTGALSKSTIRIAQAMADVAANGLLQAQIITRRDPPARQLQNALQSRVLMGQAKGAFSQNG